MAKLTETNRWRLLLAIAWRWVLSKVLQMINNQVFIIEFISFNFWFALWFEKLISFRKIWWVKWFKCPSKIINLIPGCSQENINCKQRWTFFHVTVSWLSLYCLQGGEKNQLWETQLIGTCSLALLNIWVASLGLYCVYVCIFLGILTTNALKYIVTFLFTY